MTANGAPSDVDTMAFDRAYRLAETVGAADLMQ